MKTLKTIMLSLSAGCLALALTACCTNHQNHSWNNEDTTFVASSDLALLTSSLLSVNQKQFTYQAADGTQQPDELQQFKALEALYIRTKLDAQNSNSKSQTASIKLMMFFAYYADSRNNGAFSEYLASDILPIYQNDPAKFLQVMQELPFFTTAVCNRLNTYFYFEKNLPAEKVTFINTNYPLISNYLSTTNTEQCLQELSRQP